MEKHFPGEATWTDTRGPGRRNECPECTAVIVGRPMEVHIGMESCARKKKEITSGVAKKQL
jgi:hypothetical protein